jgi:hypothetical protein
MPSAASMKDEASLVTAWSILGFSAARRLGK